MSAEQKSIASHLRLKEALDHNPSLKLDVVADWGKPQKFIDAFDTNQVGVLNFIAKLHEQVLAQTKQRSAKMGPSLSRKKSDSKFDDPQYLDDLEQKLLKELKIDQEPSPVQSMAEVKKRRPQLPLTRSKSDPKDDNPEYEAKIKTQTLRMIETLTGGKVAPKQQPVKTQAPPVKKKTPDADDELGKLLMELSQVESDHKLLKEFL